MEELNAAGQRTKRGKPLDEGAVYKLLKNRAYVGEVEHKGTAYAGEHEAIVTRETWDKAHARPNFARMGDEVVGFARRFFRALTTGQG